MPEETSVPLLSLLLSFFWVMLHNIKQGRIIQNNVIYFENAVQVTAVQVNQKFKTLLRKACTTDEMFKDILNSNNTNKKFVRINS